jgi:tRNA (adenine57-N1/adenine58-N1)-methyltransferase
LRLAQAGDTVLLVNERDRRRFVRILEPGKSLQTHRGKVNFDDLIGQPMGTEVRTHLGFPYYMFVPTTDDLVTNAIRKSQIIFPKDAGYIVMKLGVRSGSRVVEAGTGSGGLCVALATIVGDDGHVYSYDVRETMQEYALQNLKRCGLKHRVTLRTRDAREGFDERDVDAVFLDMLSPQECMTQARVSLRGSGLLGCLVPTANQVIELLQALYAGNEFGFIEVEELILRSYKPVVARLRPEDRMVGHTGYLVFARALIKVGRTSDQFQNNFTDDSAKGVED